MPHLRLSEAQFAAIEARHRQSERESLRRDLAAYHDDMTAEEVEHLFAQCSADCAELGIESAQGEEAFFSASFAVGESIRNAPDFDTEHHRWWLKTGDPDRFSLAIRDKLARDAEVF